MKRLGMLSFVMLVSAGVSGCSRLSLDFKQPQGKENVKTSKKELEEIIEEKNSITKKLKETDDKIQAQKILNIYRMQEPSNRPDLDIIEEKNSLTKKLKEADDKVQALKKLENINE